MKPNPNRLHRVLAPALSEGHEVAMHHSTVDCVGACVSSVYWVISSTTESLDTRLAINLELIE